MDEVQLAGRSPRRPTFGEPLRAEAPKALVNTCLRSQPQRDLPEVCAAVLASAEPRVVPDVGEALNEREQRVALLRRHRLALAIEVIQLRTRESTHHPAKLVSVVAATRQRRECRVKPRPARCVM